MEISISKARDLTNGTGFLPGDRVVLHKGEGANEDDESYVHQVVAVCLVFTGMFACAVNLAVRLVDDDSAEDDYTEKALTGPVYLVRPEIASHDVS